MTAAFLPGLEDVESPSGPRGWDLAFLRVSRHPAKRIILEAIRRLAGTRDHCPATNAAILGTIVELGHRPPSLRGVKSHLRELDETFGLIARDEDSRPRSRRMIRLLFIHKGVDDHHPSVSTIITPRCRRSSPLGVDDHHPSAAQTFMVQTPAPSPVFPNTFLIQKERTSTLPPAPPPERSRNDSLRCSGKRITRPEVHTHDEVMRRWQERIEETQQREEAGEIVEGPAYIPKAPPMSQGNPRRGAGGGFRLKAEELVAACLGHDAGAALDALLLFLGAELGDKKDETLDFWRSAIERRISSADGFDPLVKLIVTAKGADAPARYFSRSLARGRPGAQKLTPGVSVESPPGASASKEPARSVRR
jgi:hypothetical protein